MTATLVRPALQARIILIGPPARLAGLVHVRNPGPEKLKVKTAALALKGHEGRVPEMTIDARLAAGEARHVHASLALDPGTPPGELHGEASIAGERREVVLKVLEHREAVVVPSSFALHGKPGDSVRVPMVVTNVGNVPFEVPRVALLAVAQARGFHQLFHVAMARRGREGHQAALDSFAQLLHETEVSPPRATITEGAGRCLAPGESLETAIAFELPNDLARHRRYRGTFTLAGAECAVEIVVDTPSAEPEPGAPR